MSTKSNTHVKNAGPRHVSCSQNEEKSTEDS